MNFLMPAIFILGILAIALEDKIRINKATTAVLMCISLWLVLLINANSLFILPQILNFRNIFILII